MSARRDLTLPSIRRTAGPAGKLRSDTASLRAIRATALPDRDGDGGKRLRLGRDDDGRTSEAQAERPRGLSPGHWIAIGTVVLGGIVGFALSEHNARLRSVEATTQRIAASQADLATSQAALVLCHQ